MSSLDKKKKNEPQKGFVRDDYYDRVNYYEARNIFSSNELVNPGNRLFTNQATLSHPVWDRIKSSQPGQAPVIEPKITESSTAKKELVTNLVTSLGKLYSSSDYAPIGCKKCGYGKYNFFI
jgi:hypothetical protein